MHVDPRAWNIAAGLCLATGCGARTISIDGGSEDMDGTDAPEGSSSPTTIDTLETNTAEDPPECVSSDDCPYWYYCYDGQCVYAPHHDGHLDHTEEYWYAECYSDIDCAPLELCEFDYCEPLQLPQSCPAPDAAQALMIPAAALALSFVDLDDDGADELAVATQSDLHVFESGSNMPTTSPRGLDSPSVDAMVAGAFDMAAGEDLVLLFADELRLHGSDGVSGFGMPSVSPSGWADSVGLAAGEFDGQAPADLLVWSGTGSGVVLGGGQSFALDMDASADASARSLSDPVGGFVLAYEVEPLLRFYTPAGNSIALVPLRGGPPTHVTSFENLGDGFDLSASVIETFEPWTILEEWGPATGNAGSFWGVLGVVQSMASGDFDGDGHADIAMIVDGGVQVHFGAHDPGGCIVGYPLDDAAAALAVGDHDGDGDDELAVRTLLTGEIALINGE